MSSAVNTFNVDESTQLVQRTRQEILPAAFPTPYRRECVNGESDDLISNARHDNAQVASFEEDAAQASGDLRPNIKSEPQSAKGKCSKHSHRLYDRITSDYWTLELIGVSICVASLASVVGILWAYQNRPTPRIMHSISLNTAISILATFSRTSAVFVATSVIAQQKWLRFEEKFHTLYDTLLYDDATRGPLGSIYLLRSFQVGFATVLAASVAILSLGFEPFVQQSIKYPLRNQVMLSQASSIPTVQNVIFKNQPTSNLTVLINTAILQALYADSVVPLRPACVGTSCDWAPYTSVAFCHSCEDAMDDIVIEPPYDAALQAYGENDYLSNFRITDVGFGGDFSGYAVFLTHPANTTYNISLGVGYPVQFNLSTTAGLVVEDPMNGSSLSYPETLVWDLNGPPGCEDSINPWTKTCLQWSNTTINGVEGPLRAFGHVRLARAADDSRLVPTAAHRCIITLCAQKYSTAIINGTFSSHVTESTFGYYSRYVTYEQDNNFNFEYFANYETLLWNASMNGSYFGVENSTDNPFILPSFYAALAELEGTIGRWYGSGDPVEYSSTGINQNGTGTSSVGPDLTQFMSNVPNATARIAQSLTNFIQQNGDGYAMGNTYIATPFVEVRWAWLTYPLALVLIGVAALFATMYQTRRRRVPLWKYSPFPMLFNYHDHDACATSDSTENDDSNRMISQAVTTSRHEEIARETQLRLRSTGGFWTFEKTS